MNEQQSYVEWVKAYQAEHGIHPTRFECWQFGQKESQALRAERDELQQLVEHKYPGNPPVKKKLYKTGAVMEKPKLLNKE